MAQARKTTAPVAGPTSFAEIARGRMEALAKKGGRTTDTVKGRAAKGGAAPAGKAATDARKRGAKPPAEKVTAPAKIKAPKTRRKTPAPADGKKPIDAKPNARRQKAPSLDEGAQALTVKPAAPAETGEEKKAEKLSVLLRATEAKAVKELAATKRGIKIGGVFGALGLAALGTAYLMLKGVIPEFHPWITGIVGALDVFITGTYFGGVFIGGEYGPPTLDKDKREVLRVRMIRRIVEIGEKHGFVKEGEHLFDEDSAGNVMAEIGESQPGIKQTRRLERYEAVLAYLDSNEPAVAQKIGEIVSEARVKIREHNIERYRNEMAWRLTQFVRDRRLHENVRECDVRVVCNELLARANTPAQLKAANDEPKGEAMFKALERLHAVVSEQSNEALIVLRLIEVAKGARARELEEAGKTVAAEAVKKA